MIGRDCAALGGTTPTSSRPSPITAAVRCSAPRHRPSSRRYGRRHTVHHSPLKRQLRVSDRLKRPPVQRTRPQGDDRVAVLGRRVARVQREAEARVVAVAALHEAVARDLCDHRRSGDRGASGRRRRSPGGARRGTGAAGNRRRGRRPPDGRRARGSSRARRSWSREARASRCPRRSGPSPKRGSPRGSPPGRALRAPRASASSSRRALKSAPVGHRERSVVEEDRRRDQRPGERAPARLVAPGDVADAELAVELEELRGLPAAALQRLRAGLRRGRFLTGASR